MTTTRPMLPDPEASAVCQAAAGSFSTGIIEAQVTSASRKIVPLKVSGITSQSGPPRRAAGITAQTAARSQGASSSSGNFRFADHIGGERDDQDGGHDGEALPTRSAFRAAPA